MIHTQKGAALPEYIILLGVLLISSLVAVTTLSEQTRTPFLSEDPVDTPDWYPGDTPIDTDTDTPTIVGVGDPTGGPETDTSTTPPGPSATTTPPPGSPGGSDGGTSVTVITPGPWPTYVTTPPPCAPYGAYWNGSAYEVPGVVHIVNRGPQHFTGYTPLQQKPPHYGTLRTNVDYYQFWYPNYMGEWYFFFAWYDQWGKEVVIPPYSIQPPGPGCY